ncbi:tripartite tricarboxylate transporter TctB family protein [Actinotignum sp. GS-2025a]|uniref:tripartite tricarboxylate transporter TctB family protein n=1 Tax=Actinotignum sp. GS-2025a TaxID=3427274 RepID=UPI003F4724C6
MRSTTVKTDGDPGMHPPGTVSQNTTGATTSAPIQAQRPGGNRDIGALVFRLVILGIGIYVIVAGWNYGLSQDNGEVGAGLMPFIAGCVIVLASIWDLIRSSITKPAPATSPEDDESVQLMEQYAAEDTPAEGERTERQRQLAVVYVFLAMLGAIILTRVIGLLLSVTLMVFVLVVFVERRTWWKGLLAAILTFLFGYVVFSVLLQVPLPTGMLDLV